MAGNSAAIANYFASLSVKVDTKSLQRVDKLLKDIESKLSKFSFTNPLRFSKFSVNQRALEKALGDALDGASRRTTFEISRFTINEKALRSSLTSALGRTNVAAPVSVGNRSQRSSASAAAGGGLSALAMGYRAFLPLAALAGGGFGLSALNERNQRVVSAQLQSQAVVQQAGGTAAQGQQSFEWLRNQGNRVGFNYLDAVGDYNKLLSGLTGAGMSVSQGQGVFKGFSELSRVNKLDRNAQTRVYRALSQIAGKNKLQSEELTGQLAESLPGAVSIFAQAYQNQRGGSKTGQEAITELLAAMKKGQVKGDILTYAGAVASQQAAPGLAAASTASQAEQARYQNSLSDLSVLASKSGIEEGFARIFRTLNDGLKESGPLVERLSQGFNEATKAFRVLALVPQSFTRMLDGKDSFIGNLIGPEQVAQWQMNTKALADSWKSFTLVTSDVSWAEYLKTTLKELNGLFTILNDTITTGQQIFNVLNNAPKVLEQIGNDQNLAPADRVSLIGDLFSKKSGSMSMEDWSAKIDSYKAERDKRNTYYVDGENGNYNYSKDNLGFGDVPYAPGQTAPTNNTVSVTVGDIVVQGGNGSAQDIGTELGKTLQQAFQDQFAGMSLNFAKVGR